MVDVFTKAKRSQVMSQIRAVGNKATELALIKLFRSHGFTGWRRHRRVFGKPDFIFSKERVAVFVDGCFWHCCPKHGTKPKTNPAFWELKLSTNKERDRRVNRVLRKNGWIVVRIWQHELCARNKSHLLRKLVAIIPPRHQ
jgi:DNA mismatch endonuclease (patch repair protein)